jgi:hypothetical protein
VGEQTGPDAALGDRLGRQNRLGDLWVVVPRVTGPAGVGGANQFPNEDGRRLIIEAFAGALANADRERTVGSTDLFSFAQLDFYPATR